MQQANNILHRPFSTARWRPGFAFKYHRKGVSWDRLLSGKTADVIVTSDTPPLLDTLLYLKAGRRVLKKQVLGFCGIKTKRIVQFGSVKLASPAKIQGWLRKAGRFRGQGRGGMSGGNGAGARALENTARCTGLASDPRFDYLAGLARRLRPGAVIPFQPTRADAHPFRQAAHVRDHLPPGRR